MVRDEAIMMLTKNYDKSQVEVASLKRELNELKKGNTGGDAQVKAL
jgi:predicted RNase H-like nuclease (RuvC/YqgF family)